MMSAPCYAIFCSKGHLTRVVKHREIENVVTTKCKFCGSSMLTTQVGFGDESYEQVVPRQNIGYEYIDGRRVYIFDVSGVTDWKYFMPDVIRVCRECKEEYLLKGGEIAFYKYNELELPKRCESCRNKRKK